MTLGIQTTLLDRLPWLGHLERMWPVDRIPHNTLHARFKGKRNNGRPRLCWIDNIHWDIILLRLTPRETMNLTKDRGQWRSFIIHTHRH